MTETTYAVLFRGKFVEGVDRNEAKAAFGRLFKLDPQRLEKLFAQRQAILKRGLSEREARRYEIKLHAIGIVIELLPQRAAPEKIPPLPTIGQIEDTEIRPASSSQEWGPYASMGWGQEERPAGQKVNASELALEPESETRKRVPSSQPPHGSGSAAVAAGSIGLQTGFADTGSADYGLEPYAGGGGYTGGYSARTNDDAGPEKRVRELSFEFTGDGWEFFRIWIVNVLLSIVTLGIYSAWAKVRTMRYFYGNTRLDGSSFEYLADPLKILKGRLIAFALVALYVASEWISVLLYIVCGLLLLLAIPWVISRALSFRNYNSAWRGVRFGFDGTMGGAFVSFLFWPMVPGLLVLAILLIGGVALIGALSGGRPDFSFGLILPLLLIVPVVFLVVPPLMFRSQTYYVVNNAVMEKLTLKTTRNCGIFSSFIWVWC